jgi:hypothetical protein
MASPGARITLAVAIEGFEASMQSLLSKFPNAKVVETGAAKSADGIPRGVVVIEL